MNRRMFIIFLACVYPAVTYGADPEVMSDQKLVITALKKLKLPDTDRARLVEAEAIMVQDPRRFTILIEGIKLASGEIADAVRVVLAAVRQRTGAMVGWARSVPLARAMTLDEARSVLRR